MNDNQCANGVVITLYLYKATIINDRDNHEITAVGVIIIGLTMAYVVLMDLSMPRLTTAGLMTVMMSVICFWTWQLVRHWVNSNRSSCHEQ